MNISVYFYDEEGKYTYMDMAPLEFDSEGVQILPDNSTTEFPPDLSTDPRFDVVSRKWYSQKPKMPYTSEDFLKEIKELREEVEALKNTPTVNPLLESQVNQMSKRLSKVDEELKRTNIYIGIALPSHAHYFTYQ